MSAAGHVVDAMRREPFWVWVSMLSGFLSIGLAQAWPDTTIMTTRGRVLAIAMGTCVVSSLYLMWRNHRDERVARVIRRLR